MALNHADLALIQKGLAYSRKKKKWVLALGALGISGYGAYKIYHSPSVTKKREKLLKVLGALVSVAEMLSDSAEAIGVVSRDLKGFVESDSNEIPNSLKQIAKITRSIEFADSITKITSAFTVGILRGYQYDSERSKVGNSGFSDRVLDKLFLDPGSGFVSVVVGSFARNLVMAFYLERQTSSMSHEKLNGTTDADGFDARAICGPSWVDVICEDKSRKLIGECVEIFVSTAVAVYLDKTMHINTYDEIFSGLTNPNHEKNVREMLASVCNGAVETLVRSCHQVLAGSNSVADLNFSSSLVNNLGGSGANRDSKELIVPQSVPTKFKGRNKSSDKNDSGWVRKMSSTLAVPSNRRFVLDVTGRVTFETVKSFLEFLLQKLSDCLKRSIDVVHEEVVDKGREAIRYVGGKSSSVVAICLSLCLHILNGPWILAPA